KILSSDSASSATRPLPLHSYMIKESVRMMVTIEMRIGARAESPLIWNTALNKNKAEAIKTNKLNDKEKVYRLPLIHAHQPLAVLLDIKQILYTFNKANGFFNLLFKLFGSHWL